MTFEEWWDECMGWIEYEPDQYNKGVTKAAWEYQQERIEKLLDLLDDIDTAGDMFKPEINDYFKYIQRKVGEGLQYRVEEAHKAGMDNLIKAHQIRPRGKSMLAYLPEGYVLVPVEPTTAMEEAFLDIYERRGWFMRGYKNMLKTAQEE